MMFFARAVVTGFGMSLGSALFKKVQSKLGLGEEKEKQSGEAVRQGGGATDPSLQS